MVAFRVCFIIYAILACSVSAVKFEKVIRVIEQRRLELSKHPFFALLRDETVPLERRMTFLPYWTFYAMSFADILDTWIKIPNPRNELEESINTFVGEDDFHYNFFLHDLKVLGYTLDRYGSYEAVVRHLWGDDSKAVRQLMYAWVALAKKYDEPMIVLATFEAMEAGLKDIFEIAYEYVHMPERGGLKDLEYFGATHVELEINHTVTGWFAEEEKPRPLGDYDVSEETKEKAIAVVEELMARYVTMYDALYNLNVAEDSIWPEKYAVEGRPPINKFPNDHPNRPKEATKDEL